MSRLGALPYSGRGIATAGSAWLGVRLEQGDAAGFEQGLEVGDDLGPAAGDGLDQPGVLTLDGVGDGELDGGADGFQLHGAEGGALGLELGPGLVLPADDQGPRRLRLQDFA